MADSQDPNTGNSGDGNSGSGEDQTAAFWRKFDERIDEGIKRNVENYRKNAKTGTSRTGRTTLPGILADLVFGPAPKD